MNHSPRFRNTRIAPTPSGFLHLGNLLSFALTAALAEREGASIRLRIDDLDRQRVQPEYVQDIFESLRFLGIPWHTGPGDIASFEREYAQAHRRILYDQWLNELRRRDLLFACTCSRSEVLEASADGSYPGTCLDKGLPLDHPEACWRIHTSLTSAIRVRTLDAGTIDTVLPDAMRYFVVRRKDGWPSYQLASVADDVYYGIDLIVRGEDLWESTLAQVYLAHCLERRAFSDVAFFHHSLLTDKFNRKLSKSAGDTSLQYLRRQGLDAQGIYGLLGEWMGVGELRHWSDFAQILPKFNT